MKSEFINKLNKAYNLCLTEIDKRKNGIDGEASKQQLKIIITELKRIKEMAEENKLPLIENRYFVSFALAFTVWGWNMNEPSELFLLLAELNNDYKNV